MSKLLFHEIPDGVAILKKGGVSKQTDLFHRDGKVYAAAMGGYVRIGTQGTSVPNLSIEAIDGVTLKSDGVGWYEWPASKVTNLRAV